MELAICIYLIGAIAGFGLAIAINRNAKEQKLKQLSTIDYVVCFLFWPAVMSAILTHKYIFQDDYSKTNASSDRTD